MRTEKSKKSKKFKKAKRLGKFDGRKIILCVMILAAVAVVICIVAVILNQPERVAKGKIDALARNYYEKVFYEDMLEAPNYAGDPEKALGGFAENGLSPVPVEKLLRLDWDKNASEAEYLKEYCDTEKTTVRFYPVAPYNASDYKFEVTYSCNF